MKTIIQERIEEYKSDLSGKKTFKKYNYTGGSLRGSYSLKLDNNNLLEKTVEIYMTASELIDVLNYLVEKYPKHKSPELRGFKSYKKDEIINYD